MSDKTVAFAIVGVLALLGGIGGFASSFQPANVSNDITIPAGRARRNRAPADRDDAHSPRRVEARPGNAPAAHPEPARLFAAFLDETRTVARSARAVAPAAVSAHGIDRSVSGTPVSGSSVR